MHEWGIASNIIEKIKENALENGIAKVVAAEIKLGKSLHIGIDEFRDCLQVLAQKEAGSVHGCRFDIEEVDSKLATLASIEGE
ncbi:MAG: hydrogenase/urease maturation nickel metallochaperone HypA [Candidatus Omnitrophota bacterium]